MLIIQYFRLPQQKKYLNSFVETIRKMFKKHLQLPGNSMKGIISISILAIVFTITSCSNNEKPAVANPRAADKNAKAIEKTKTILFFGNSLTAGYGLTPSEAFPALIQGKLDSLKLPYKIINAGVSGETSSGGNSRIEWILRQPLDIFVLELGGNDGLRGIPLSETKKNLQSIIDKVKEKNPAARLLIAGMQIPPNMGQKYTTEFRRVFPDLAKKNGVALVPFLLQDVGGEEKLNQPDGIHPTAEGHKIVAENVWKELQKLL
ncbi:MAG: arylesterase [Chitinophagaceae bacterium]